ncbi:MAG: membrane protein insertase YidC [Rickettsiales bacterium]|nr:membrane protein insertase YidC [Rickettsiales bacterium]
MADQKNLFLAIALSLVILITWNVLVEQPNLERDKAAFEQQQAAERASKAAGAFATKPPGQGTTPSAPVTGPATQSTIQSSPQLGAAPSDRGRVAVGLSRANAIKKAPRVQIETPRVRGSISLAGARLDDLTLKDYRVSLDKNSKQIDLLQPVHGENPYYAEFGWLNQDLKLPNRETIWKANGSTLSPDNPITLSWENGEGLVFEQLYQIDENFLLTITQRVRNKTTKDVSVAPYGLVSRTSVPDILGFYILHEGPLGVFDKTLKEVDYDDLIDDGIVQPPVRQETTGGWIGFTDKYWLVALIPDAAQRLNTSFNAGKRGVESVFQTDYLGDAVRVPAGGTIERTDRLFAGAKQVQLLDQYAEVIGIEGFDKAVDWGWFYFLTKPIFQMLNWFFEQFGNFGLAILALTVVIKLAFFPLANKSYRSMNRMKVLQPKMMELKERFGDDKQRMNQAMMDLYKKEKVNPASGCLPMLVQIPVFFALYKVLFVTIEMRQTPFYGWIDDLSAPDPLTILNGFGLIPWDVPDALSIVNIGLWPIIMGLTMFLQQRLNPTPADPIQAKIFLFMPLIFTFILAPFPAGLVIYWAWNNILSIAQQWVIMRKMNKEKS